MSTGPRRIGKYELHERLGRGGMAEVWKAWDTQLERYVAIKFLQPDLRTDPDFMTRFIREAQAVASLHHPNIVQIHDFQVTQPPISQDHLAYMVMNYIEGPTLAQYIAQTSRLGSIPSSASITYLFTAIGRAIDYAHQRGMVHRDIKPANILLDRHNTSRYPVGEPMLTDFGIVKWLGAPGTTLVGAMLGTPFYMSPEQAQGRAGNERSDIYSLGVILYEVCTGVRPFQGDTPTAVIVQHITTRPTPPNLINPNLSPTVTEVILRCLEKDPAARFPSALSLTTALSTAFNVTPLPPVAQPWPTAQQGPYITLPLPPTGPVGSFLSNQRAESANPLLPSSPPEAEHSIVQRAARPAPLTPVFDRTGQHSLPTTPVSPPGETTRPPGSPSPKRERRAILIGSLLIVLLVVVASSTGLYYWLTHNSIGSVPFSGSSVGTAVFVNSGIYSQGNNLGLEDELQIRLHTIAPLAPDKGYYAWLLSDTSTHPTQFLLLRKLPVSSGKVEIVYSYDLQHTSLLAHYSRFLITAEEANRTPTAPSSNPHAWCYYAEIPQKMDSSIGSSTVLFDIRNLLSNNPDDPTMETIGGLAPRFLKSIQAVQTLSTSARENWNSRHATALRQQVVSILYYIDGTTNVQTDVPPSQDKHTQIDETLAQTPLIDLTKQQAVSSYIYNINNRLLSLLAAPGASPTMSKRAQQTIDALPDTQNWLQQMHDYARRLLLMTDSALLQPGARDILDNMVTEANNAYNGPIDSSAPTPHTGAVFILNTIQLLAVLDVQTCTKTSAEWHCAYTSA